MTLSNNNQAVNKYEIKLMATLEKRKRFIALYVLHRKNL
jgi:hypothetical protein